MPAGGMATGRPDEDNPKPKLDMTDPLSVHSLTDAHFRTLLSHFNLTAADTMERDRMVTMLRFCTPIATTFPHQDPATLSVVFGNNYSGITLVNISDESGKVWLYPRDSEYPCSVCRANVGESIDKQGQGIECDLCGLWFHNQCLQEPCSTELYTSLKGSPSNVKLFCPRCVEHVPSLNKAFDYILDSVGRVKGLLKSIDGAKAALESSIDLSSNSLPSLADSSKVTDAIGELNEAITTASNDIRELGESVRTNTGSYESALNTVVTKVNLLDNIDINALSSKVCMTVNDIHSKLNQDVLKPSTVESLANKLIESRVNNEPSVEAPACSGLCVAAIQSKMEELNSNPSSLESNDRPASTPEQSWALAVNSRRQNFVGGNMTNSSSRSTPPQQATPQHPSAPPKDLCNKDMTVVIDNVKSRDLIKHASVIKQNFNKLHPSMKIKSCFCTSKGGVFIELTTQADAKSVIDKWQGTNFGGDVASPTTATLLINKGAQGLIKVPLEFTDATIDSELQKEYSGAKARRFVNKNKDKLYSVLITFRDFEQFQDACKNGVEIEKSFYDVAKFIQKKSITRCYRCLRFDHPAKWCSIKKQVCKHCTEDHLASQCPDPTKKKCINCNSDQHSSLDLSCPTFIQKKAIIDRLNNE